MDISRIIKDCFLFVLYSLLIILLACGAEDSTSPPFKDTIFTHINKPGLKNASTGDFYKPSLSYEPIPVDPRYRHVLSFQMTPFMPPIRKSIPSNGPLVLFSDDMDVIVFSPMDNFFISLISFEDGAIHYGVEGEVQEIPPGFTHRFLLVEGKGINAAIEHWGDLLLDDRGRERVDRYADKGLSHLGYWTDNGSYYYYAKEQGMNEEQTMLAVKEDAVKRGIPIGYLQLDSWWYFKEKKSTIGLGVTGGLVEWKPIPEMFPDGLAAFQKKLGLPLITHNRWFAKENAYKDKYEFIEDANMSLPATDDVYKEFMADAASWGVITYEQDWLVTQFWGVRYLREGAGRADIWLKGMHDAARDRGLTMQLCMAGAAHLMSAVDLPSVTTVRTSVDYRRDVSKESFWPQFHTVNMLAWALGVPPFKDNFQSSEKFGEQEALISALSAGVVGIGDRIGESVPGIITRTCRKDGLLLKPDKPATPIDAMFLDHERPLITRTFSDRKGAGRWTYIAAYHLASEHEQRQAEDEIFAYLAYDGKPMEEMFVFPKQVKNWSVNLANELSIEGKVVAYNWRTGEAFQAGESFALPAFPDLYDYAYFVFAPVFGNGIALIGETGKFVTMSDRRFLEIEESDDGVRVRIAGVPGEEVTIEAYDADAGAMLKPVKLLVGAGGEAEGTISR